MKKNQQNEEAQEPFPVKKQNSPEGADDEADLSNLTDTKFQKKVIKIPKELRVGIHRNAGYFRKELETIRRSQEKLENSFAETNLS